MRVGDYTCCFVSQKPPQPVEKVSSRALRGRKASEIALYKRPIRRIFVSKDAISHFLKLVDLVFQHAAPFSAKETTIMF
jgi:hypothetical protein